MPGRFDVIVVGAGFAGLSAATRLAAGGLRPLVLEARPVAGGRAYSFRDPATGEAVDNGQHLLAGCYRETFAFLRTIGADGGVNVQESLEVAMVDPEGRRTTLVCPPLPAPWHLAAGLVDWEAIGWADRLSAAGMAGPIRIARRQACGTTALQAASPGETAAQWLDRHGQSPRLCEMFWEPLALATLNQPASAAAAPIFARVLGELAAGDRRAAALAWSTVPLSELYVGPATRFIEGRGGAVRTSAPARVLVGKGRVAAVDVRGDRVEAGAVIVAVPWHAIGAAIGGETEPIGDLAVRAERAAASPIVTVNLWLDRIVLDVPFLGLPGRAMQWVFDKRRILGDGATHLSLVASGAAAIAGLPGRDIVVLATDELRRAVPAVRAAALRHASVVRERRATFSLAPGQPARPGARTGVSGLWLAGDWTDTGLPATIEGAVASGHRVADYILR